MIKVSTRKTLLPILLSAMFMFVLLASAIPVQAADSLSVSIGSDPVQGTLSDDTYSTEYWINTPNSEVSVSGSATNSRIIVDASGVTLNMDNVSMALYRCNGSPVEIMENGDATIVLKGGNALSAYAAGPGILVNPNAELTIRAYESDSTLNGLTVYGSKYLKYNGPDGDVIALYEYGFAGIGGPNHDTSQSDPLEYTGTINIESGSITAAGYGFGAGIGGGRYSSGGIINISGGSVTAKSEGGQLGGYRSDIAAQASGIGAPRGQDSGQIMVSGDADVKAYGGSYSPGIGGGITNVVINDTASVEAHGGLYSAGIGNSNQIKDASSITIADNATVDAYGGERASGIGQGSADSAVDLFISENASVSAWSDGTKAAITGTPENSSASILNFYMQGVDLPLPIAIPITLQKGAAPVTSLSIPVDYKAMGTVFDAGDYTVSVDLSQYQAGVYRVVPSPDHSNSFDITADASDAYNGTKTMLIAILDNGTAIQFNPTWGITVSAPDGSTNPIVFDGENGTVIVPAGGSVKVPVNVEKDEYEEVTWPLGGAVSKSGELFPAFSDVTFTKNLNEKETVSNGGSLTLSVTVEADPPTDGSALSYQWYKDGEKIVGETSSSLALSDITLGDLGQYHVTVVKTLSGITKEYPSVICTLSFSSGGGPGSSSGGSGTSYFTVRFDTQGGSQVSSQSISRNGTVTKPADPTREGFAFTGWYTDKDLTTLYDFDKKVTTSFTLYAGWDENGSEGYEHKDYEHKAYINGYSDTLGGTSGRFGPDDAMTRAQAAQTLFNIASKDDKTRIDTFSTFDDVSENAWHYTAVGSLSGWGIITGDGKGSFRPDDVVSRSEFLVMLLRFMEISQTEYADGFPDISDSYWAAGYIQAAVQAGIIEGYPDGSFGPNDDVTRAQAVVMINQALECEGISEGARFSDVPNTHWAYKAIAGAAADHNH